MTPDTQGGAGAAQGTGGSRRPLIAGNWKLWGTRAEAAEYCERLGIAGERFADVGVCPPFTALDVCVEKLRGTGVGVYAQNMHQESTGAFTGEVSAEMLTELGVDGVVLGHSERRQYACETDRALQEKVPAALAAGLQPILCVGETEEERERDETQRKLRSQVKEALEKVADEPLGHVVIAYEPIWAIGTGKVATPEIAQEAIAFIRALVGDRSTEAAERVRILYGGSVKPDNAAEILAQPDVDGALVGGASLDPEGFARIVAAAAP
jgi:triosephosphate isomerase